MVCSACNVAFGPSSEEVAAAEAYAEYQGRRKGMDIRPLAERLAGQTGMATPGLYEMVAAKRQLVMGRKRHPAPRVPVGADCPPDLR